MGERRSDFDRLLAGEIDADDPTLGQVATFLSRVQSSVQSPSVAALEDAHIARARAALPALGALPRTQRRERRAARTRRIIVTAVVGVFAAATAGVGVAAAMGVDPLDALRHVQLIPAPTHSESPSGQPEVPPPTQRPDSATPSEQQQGQPSVTGSDHRASQATEHTPNEHANPRATQTGKPTSKPSKTATNSGKSSAAQSEHKPTKAATPSTKQKKEA